MAPQTFTPIALDHGFSEARFNALLLAMHHLDFSDITIVTGKPLWGKRYGRMTTVTDRVLQDSELRTLLTWMYGPNAMAEIAKCKPLDKRYEVKVLTEVCEDANGILKEAGFPADIADPRGHSKRLPFRMNAVGAFTPKGRGVSISLRTIPINVPVLEDMQLPPDLLPYANQDKGLTMVAGETGSGKSTLLAAIMRDKLVNREDRKIITIESPIEFDLQRVRSESCVVVQHEIGQDLPSFYQGIVNSLRQAPTDILVGEARDEESIDGMINAAETGHATYATVHASSVVGTLRRVANEYDPKIQDQIIFKVITQLRLIIVQRLLVSKSGGKRVPVREWLVFDDQFKAELLRLSTTDALNKIEDEVNGRGQSMRQQVLAAYREGLIDSKSLRSVIGDFTEEERKSLMEIPEVADAA